MINTTISPLPNLINITFNASNELDICMTKEGFYSAECLYRNVCQSLSSQFLKTGLIILGLFILISWLLIFFNNSWHKRFNYFDDPINLYRWNDFIKTRLLNLFFVRLLKS